MVLTLSEHLVGSPCCLQFHLYLFFLYSSSLPFLLCLSFCDKTGSSSSSLKFLIFYQKELCLLSSHYIQGSLFHVLLPSKTWTIAGSHTG